MFESNTPKTIGLMPPFIRETLAQCPPRSDFKSHAAIFSITWIQSSLTHLILAAKLGGFKETNLLAAQPAVPWSASNVSNFPCSKTGDFVSPHCDAALKNLQIPYSPEESPIICEADGNGGILSYESGPKNSGYEAGRFANPLIWPV